VRHEESAAFMACAYAKYEPEQTEMAVDIACRSAVAQRGVSHANVAKLYPIVCLL